MIEVNKKLPEKRSELLRLAVRDAIKISQNPKFEFYMGDWYVKFKWDDTTNRLVKRDKCTVCLAGAVMVCTLKVLSDSIEANVKPSHFDLDIRKKLHLINDLRQGVYDSELNNDIWNYKYTDEKCNTIKSAYKLIINNFGYVKGHAPWVIYFQAANILESVGL